MIPYLAFADRTGADGRDLRAAQRATAAVGPAGQRGKRGQARSISGRDEAAKSPVRSAAAGIALGQLGADPCELGLNGSRFFYLDHPAPAGEVPGDVDRCRCGDAASRTAPASFPV